MLDRLMGTETEYAIRYGDGSKPLGREVAFTRIIEAVRAEVAVTRARGLVNLVRKRVFTANGGALYYEHQPRWPDHGLVEGATPECRGPASLLRYQRAQDRLLERAVRRVQLSLPHGTRLGLRKNARDSDGNIYGPQESYEAIFASGWRLWLWRAGVVLLIPWVFGAMVVLWSLLIVLVGVMLVFAIWTVALTVGSQPEDLERWQRKATQVSTVVIEAATHVTVGPALFCLALLVRGLGFRRHRRALLAFLASRCLVSGAGSLLEDGRFVLSEKIYGLKRVMRWTTHASDRAIFEIGHLMKALSEPMMLRPSQLGRLMAQRQRLQLSLSDSNRCDVAEYLKLGTTALILDMAEAGALDDAPVPRKPLQAARKISDDPGLTAQIELKDGSMLTGMQLQRWYQQRAQSWVEGQDVANLQGVELVQLWGEVLDALQHDPDSLIGQLDWVSKRALINRAEQESEEVRKRIDLGYHDLIDGFHATLDEAGLVRRLLDDDEIERAIEEPPADSPAGLRGRLVQQGATAVDWDRAKVGGKVIRLDRYRKR